MTTQQIRERGLDQFYTLPEIAKKCIETVEAQFPWDHWDLVIEPSAGNGSFLHQIPVESKIGIDLDPHASDIQKGDQLQQTPPNHSEILVIGNPPFGKVSSKAIQFFNHSANHANCIAFIIPRTFRKQSVESRLNRSFHLIHDDDIRDTPCAFDPPMNAKCCFQIWVRRPELRDIPVLPTKHADWDFLPLGPLDERGQPTPPTGADFAIRAQGGQCGFIQTTELETLRPKSWHWIRSKIPVETLIERFRGLDYSKSHETARQNSMGKAELIQLQERSRNS